MEIIPGLSRGSGAADASRPYLVNMLAESMMIPSAEMIPVVIEAALDAIAITNHYAFDRARFAQIAASQDVTGVYSSHYPPTSPGALELVCEPDADYMPRRDDVPGIEVV